MSIQAKLLKRFLGIFLPRWLKADGIHDSRTAMEKFSIYAKIPADISQSFVNIQGLDGEWITPDEVIDDRVILYLHGGGYVIGSVNTHRDLIARICRAGKARSLAINYRLAPEDPFPAALEDAIKAYLWLIAEDISPQKIILAGDSAGGGLVLSTLISLRDSGNPLPAGAVCLSPWTDLAGTGESINTKASSDPFLSPDEDHAIAKLYAGDNDLKHPLISPLYADLRGLSPFLIQVGTEEILLDDSIRLARRLKESGVKVTLEVWEGMIHVFQVFAKFLPEGREAIAGIGKFIDACVT